MAEQLQQGFFLVLAGTAVVAAFGVVFNRNAVHGALALLANFGVLAVLYLTLNAQFIAVAQIVVYAGAVVVLFLFVVMLLGAGGGQPQWESWLNWRIVFIVVAALVLLTLIGTVVFEGPIGGATGSVTPKQIAEVGQTQAVGAVLFTDFLLPFELASVLLLIGMVGAVVLGHRWRGVVASSKQQNQDDDG
jgi:NADH-quinone oxidoreductase subunit J